MTAPTEGTRWFAADHPGLLDFWQVYEDNYDSLMQGTLLAARDHVEFAPLVAQMKPEMMAAQNAQSRQRMRNAVAGAWVPYETELRRQGATYAQMGVSFNGWYDLVGSFHRQMVPLLLRAYEKEPARLAASLGTMQTFVDRTMAAIGDEYLRTKENLIHEQRRLAERNEERYQMLFDNGPVPMWVYDVATLRFLAVNRAAVAQYGYSEAEFLAMTIEDIRFPEDLPRLREENQRVKDKRNVTDLGEWRHRRKDGSAIIVELRLENFIFLGKRAHLIVASDVTERKKVARALEESEERYRSLVASTSSVVWTADGNGDFTRPQPSWDEYTGQSWEEHRGRGWLEAFHKDDRERIARAWDRAVEMRALFDVQGRLWCAAKDEYRFFVARAVPLFDEKANAREWIGTITDVDDEKKAEQPGRFFTLALDLLCIAGVDGYFKRLNPAFNILGYSESELMAQPLVDFVHPDDRAQTLAAIERLARGDSTVKWENRQRCKDGSYRNLLWAAAPDPSGLIFAAARDATDDKRVEAERIELNRLLTLRNEELTRASRAKSDFLAMMSHELRTPLNSIIGFSEVLLDGKFGALNEKQSRYLGNVLQSGRHLLALINDLLDLSKIEAGRVEVALQPCDSLMAAADALATLQPLADARNVKLVLDPTPVPLVSADGARFKQVLYNLLSNAIKFTPAAGTVSVAATLDGAAGRVRLTVSDTGAGISADDQRRLFTPFTQLENARDHGGTGLGLALTRQLVELMGGTIGVSSELGKGSVFHVQLPLAVQAAPVVKPLAVQGVVAPLALIVDDDDGARELLTLALAGHGFRTLTAANGEDGITLARRSRPDVITLDIQLPSIDGWDVLRLLKSDRETAHIPVVMISISSDRAKAFSLGALEHLVKPVGRDELLEVLRRRNFTAQLQKHDVNVLAIDDDLKQLELFRAALEPQGFRVRTESSARAGVKAALEGPVDLVLLDLVMPDLSGIEVVAQLRADERTRTVPILMVTAHELSAAQRARLNGDVEAILSKGVSRLEDLMTEITRALARAPSLPRSE